jgi:hypothetical protein
MSESSKTTDPNPNTIGKTMATGVGIHLATSGLFRALQGKALSKMPGAERSRLFNDIQRAVPRDPVRGNVVISGRGKGPAYYYNKHEIGLPLNRSSAASAWHEAGHATIRAKVPVSLRGLHTGLVGGAHNLAGIIPTSAAEYLSSRLHAPSAFKEEGLAGKIQNKVLSNQGTIMAALHAPRLVEEGAASIIGAAISKKLPASAALELLAAFGTYAGVAGWDVYAASKGSKAYLKNKEEYLKQQQNKTASLRLLTLYADDMAEMGINAYRVHRARKGKDNAEDPSQISATGVQYRPHTFLQKKTQDFTGSF